MPGVGASMTYTGTGPLIKDGKTLIYTDGDGFYSLSGLQAGTYTFHAKQGSTIDYAEQVTISAGQTLTKDINYTAPVHITLPRIMAVAIVAIGEELLVEAEAPSGASGWTMSLSNKYKTIPLAVSDASYGATKIWNGTRPGWQITAGIISREEMTEEDGFTAYFDLQKTGEKLLVRPRHPGDRFQPLGMSQPKKLGEFMIDSKIPAAWRERVPIVSSPHHILWVVGGRIDERVKVTEATKRVLRLKFQQR